MVKFSLDETYLFFIDFLLPFTIGIGWYKFKISYRLTIVSQLRILIAVCHTHFHYTFKVNAATRAEDFVNLQAAIEFWIDTNCLTHQPSDQRLSVDA